MWKFFVIFILVVIVSAKVDLYRRVECQLHFPPPVVPLVWGRKMLW